MINNFTEQKTFTTHNGAQLDDVTLVLVMKLFDLSINQQQLNHCKMSYCGWSHV